MEEYIGKVKLNLEFYKGEDVYSDGDVENDLLDIVKRNDDYMEVLSKDNRWPILYHLSPQRENIMAISKISKTDDVLEIGSGCGAVTGAIAQRAKSVNCIELSKRRSTINAYKNKKYDNIEIFVGNFEDIELSKKYDVITLIGVFEYAKSYISSNTPYDDFLKKIKLALNENGRLYIAIENKFGLKYFAGCKEDHIGKEFEGIEGYVNSTSVQTFSRSELECIIKRNGFNKINFYYPFPDYKLPNVIFSDKRLPRYGEIERVIHNYDQERSRYFDESLAFNNLLNGDEFKIFSNSFLLEIEV